MQFDTNEIETNPRLVLIKILLGSEKLKYSGYSESSRDVANTRIVLHEKTGVLDKSYAKLREEFGIEVMDVEEDMNLLVSRNDIDVFTSSSWFNRLNEKEEREFIKAVALELQRLELPFVIIEKYIECLLYGGKLKLPLVPMYSIYCLDVLGDSFSPSLNTEDKRWLKILMRTLLKIPPKGAIPKDKKEIWKSFKSIIFEKSKSEQVRRLKNMKAKFVALEDKKMWTKFYSEKENVHHKMTDLDLVGRAYEGDGSKDIQYAQNIKKHRERIRKYTTKSKDK